MKKTKDTQARWGHAYETVHWTPTMCFTLCSRLFFFFLHYHVHFPNAFLMASLYKLYFILAIIVKGSIDDITFKCLAQDLAQSKNLVDIN